MIYQGHDCDLCNMTERTDAATRAYNSDMRVADLPDGWLTIHGTPKDITLCIVCVSMVFNSTKFSRSLQEEETAQ